MSIFNLKVLFNNRLNFVKQGLHGKLETYAVLFTEKINPFDPSLRVFFPKNPNVHFDSSSYSISYFSVSTGLVFPSRSQSEAWNSLSTVQLDKHSFLFSPRKSENPKIPIVLMISIFNRFNLLFLCNYRLHFSVMVSIEQLILLDANCISILIFLLLRSWN